MYSLRCGRIERYAVRSDLSLAVINYPVRSTELKGTFIRARDTGGTELTFPLLASRSLTGHSRTEAMKQKLLGVEAFAPGYQARSSTGAACGKMDPVSL